MKYLILLFSLMSLAATCSEANKISKDCLDQSKVDPDKVCIEVYDPVCGCDGKTYPNECYAERSGLTRWEKGKCDE